MVIVLKLTRKVWCIDIVTLRTWVGLAVWRTRASAVKGWGAERRPHGFRLTTPLVGVGCCVALRDDRRRHG